MKSNDRKIMCVVSIVLMVSFLKIMFAPTLSMFDCFSYLKSLSLWLIDYQLNRECIEIDNERLRPFFIYVV